MEIEAYYYEHQRTKTPLLWLKNADNNKLFSIDFLTPPQNSSGTPHILEHSVLNASEKYPVKEPFLELLKSSVYTYLNAWTYGDYTCYPVSSQNHQDLQNLMDVYLEAVFHPQLSEETFWQEGWRYEIGDDGVVRYQGVVFNEMKGARSDPEFAIYYNTLKALYPNSIYTFESGGLPEEIPQLTFEDFRAFHKQYYHPSNARIILYGNLEIEAFLRKIDSALEGFEFRSSPPLPSLPPATNKIQTIEATYDQADTNKAISTVSWRFDWDLSAEEEWALHLLQFILLRTEAAPLKRALLESGLGEEVISWGVPATLPRLCFVVGLKGVKPENLSKVEELVTETLMKLTGGIDFNLVEAAFNRTLFNLKDLEETNGLEIMGMVQTHWIYGRDPLEGLSFQEHIEKIKKDAHKVNFFGNLIQKYFLDNPNRLNLRFIAQPNLLLQKQAAQVEELMEQQKAGKLPNEESIRENQEKLKAWQETKDAPEALQSIPHLGISDLNRQAAKTEQEIFNIEGGQVHQTLIPTRGTVMINLLYDLRGLREDLILYLNLYQLAVDNLGTRRHSFDELATLKATYTGGINTTIDVNQHFVTRDIHLHSIFGARFLEENTLKALDIMQEVLQEIDFSDTKRLEILLKRQCKKIEEDIIQSGHRYARRLAMAKLDREEALNELLFGISYLKLLRKLLESKEGVRTLPETLKEIHNHILNQSGPLTIQLLGKPPEALNNHLIRFTTGGERKPNQLDIKLQKNDKQALIIPSDVNFVALSQSLKNTNFERHGYFDTVNNATKLEYLWPEIRAKGGAYGVGASLRQTAALFTLHSFRDPSLETTLESFNKVKGWLQEYNPTKEEIEKGIIGTIGAGDNSSITPTERANEAFWDWLLGFSEEDKQLWRDETFATQAEHFHKLGEVLNEVEPHQSATVILGNADKINEYQVENPDIVITNLFEE